VTLDANRLKLYSYLYIQPKSIVIFLVTVSPTIEPCIFGPYSITDEHAQNRVQISFTPFYVTYSAKRNSVLETGT
jgi:hypothetical protein